MGGNNSRPMYLPEIRKRESYNRGLGVAPSQCPSGKTQNYTGLCYDACPNGFTNQSSGSCSQVCPSGTKDYGVGCEREFYDRGTGTLPVVRYLK
jgi:hypothetical protein